MKREIQAGIFKAECLRIMEEVRRTQTPVIVTKHKIPIVKIVPFDLGEQSLFGKMKGTVHIHGDIVQPIDEVWDANS